MRKLGRGHVKHIPRLIGWPILYLGIFVWARFAAEGVVSDWGIGQREIAFAGDPAAGRRRACPGDQTNPASHRKLRGPCSAARCLKPRAAARASSNVSRTAAMDMHSEVGAAGAAAWLGGLEGQAAGPGVAAPGQAKAATPAAAVPPRAVLGQVLVEGAARPPHAVLGQVSVEGAVLEWIVKTRPYLTEKVTGAGLPLDVVLAPGDHGLTILHQMIDSLRQEAGYRARGSGGASHAVPWEAILLLPGVAQFSNAQVPAGPARGKTPLCFAAGQCMQGMQYRAACKAIVQWLLVARAQPDLPQSPDKSPLMIAAGCGNADVFDLLITARASVDPPAGPGLDAVLRAVTKLQGEEVNITRVLLCLEQRGYPVEWKTASAQGVRPGNAGRRARSAAAGSAPAGARSAAAGAAPPNPWHDYRWGTAVAPAAAGAGRAAAVQPPRAHPPADAAPAIT